MSRPKVHVLYAPGNNCHHETLEAFRLAGAEAELILLTADILRGGIRLTDCDLLAIPGGFSFGDHIAAGRIFAIELTSRLADQLQEVKRKGIPVIGICNGFQILVNSGLLPGDDCCPGLVDRNQSALFESRWVTLQVQDSDCVWTRGLGGQLLRLPVAHGEGRVLLPEDFPDERTVFRYGESEGTLKYPDNPNGSPGGRAGICDSSGRILGLMPHPERAVYDWLGSRDGLGIFQSGVAAVR